MNHVPGVPTRTLLSLDDPAAADPALIGGKAARLAALRAAGHPVPDGFVLTAEDTRDAGDGLAPWAEDAVREAAARLGGVVAVRSSGVAEDLDGASFAGQYETVLEVAGPDAVVAAVRRCLASAHSERVRAYLAARGLAGAGMAVIVQRMVRARAAGVAFTVHPVTGARDTAVVSAVAGLGDALVSGEADAEEWEVRGGEARRVRAADVLGPADVLAVAALARAVGDGAPTDVEWAYEGDTLWLLQARPMTAVPDPVEWRVDAPGAYLRHFRLGEWIGAPLTPLSESWLVTGLEEGLHDRAHTLFGLAAPRPLHVIVNGWYYYGGLNYDMSPWAVLRALPRILWNLPRHFHEMMSTSVKPLGFHAEYARWQTHLAPAYRAVVAEAEAAIGTASPAELIAHVDRLVAAAATQFTSIVGVAGYGATCEFGLLAFLKAHAPAEQWSVHEIISGGDATPSAHDVEGLDWIFPTLGERGVAFPTPPSPEARAEQAARRGRAEARVRAALPAGRRSAFDKRVREARIGHEARQSQTGLFTLAWPTMRRALARLGDHLVARGVLDTPADVVFLQRAELVAAVAGATARPPVAERRALWDRQRRLAPPLFLGQRVGLYKTIWDQIDPVMKHPDHDAPDAIAGMPGSPGRVTGVARVVRSVDDLARLAPGEVLVAPVTTPAWSLAFDRAAAVVTDTGSIGSHASIVAREHGIPAVVATGDGTRRIGDGQRVTVDGSIGVVRLGA